MHKLHFYEVLEILLATKEQVKARRAKWSSIEFVVAVYDVVLEKKVLERHTCLRNYDMVDAVTGRWSPSSEELLADDWIIEYE